MPVWQWLLDVAGLVLLLVLLYGLALVVRRRVLSRHGGTFELSYRAPRPSAAGRGWLLGLGRYSGRVARVVPDLLAVTATQAGLARVTDLTYSGRRESPEALSELSLYAGHVVVACHYPDQGRSSSR